jgi:hypothetical protein
MAVVALSRWAEQLTSPRWNVDKMQQDFPVASVEILSDPAIWQLVQREDQDQVLSRCLDTEADSGFTRTPGHLLANADRLDTLGLLSPAQETRVHAALQAASPWLLLGNGVRIDYVARAIIRELDDNSFAVARDGVTALLAVRRDELVGLDADLQHEIGKILAYAARNNTFAAIDAMNAIAASPEDWPANLRAGAVVGGLVGKWYPLQHQQTSEAALRIALTDSEGHFAQAALDALGPDTVHGSPPGIYQLRPILDNEYPTPAVSKLKTFLDRVEHGDVAAT